jgi:hypothetical protein
VLASGFAGFLARVGRRTCAAACHRKQEIPAKKALADFGMAEPTSAEKFWYVLECIGLGAGYFAKLSTAKALSEMPQFHVGG